MQVLEKLRDQHVLPAIIIEHRQIAKRLEGFVEFEQQPQVSSCLQLRCDERVFRSLMMQRCDYMQ